MNETCHEFPVIHSFTSNCSVAVCLGVRAWLSQTQVVVTPDGPHIQAQCRTPVLHFTASHVTAALPCLMTALSYLIGPWARSPYVFERTGHHDD